MNTFYTIRILTKTDKNGDRNVAQDRLCYPISISERIMLSKSNRWRKNPTIQWRLMRRCVLFTTTICVIPVILVFLVATDQYVRAVRNKKIFGKLELNAIDYDYIGSLKDWSFVEKRMEKRKDYLQKACENLELSKPGDDPLHRPNPWEYLINKEHHLIWCNVFKAASTSWLYNFNILAGYEPKVLEDDKQVPVAMARKKYPRPSLEELEEAMGNSLSFLIVRHPFERLLSAYRNKLEHSLSHTFYQKLGFEIVAKYRNIKDMIKLKRQRWPTFHEFILYLFNMIDSNETLDMHWTPITNFCTPCMFNYTIIAHMETLDEDQNYIIYKAGLEGIIKPQWRNKGRTITEKQINKYYSQLTKFEILRLYEFFKFDFKLFNYTVDEYVEVGKPNKEK